MTDTGSGIPADRLSRIFDDFVTTKRRGLGLGLAISKRIVEQLDGTITVESEVGRGYLVQAAPQSTRRLGAGRSKLSAGRVGQFSGWAPRGLTMFRTLVKADQVTARRTESHRPVISKFARAAGSSGTARTS